MVTERTEARRRYSSSEIQKKLLDADGALATGQSISSICERLGITRQTYYRWRKSHFALQGKIGNNGGTDEATRLEITPMRSEGPGATLIERVRSLQSENQKLRDAIIALLLEKMTFGTK